MIQHYLKIAFRNLLKHKTQTIVSILGLMGGIICFSVCTYLARELSKGDSHFPDYNRMVKVFGQDHRNKLGETFKKELLSGKELKEFLEFNLDEVECIAKSDKEVWYTLEFDHGAEKPVAYSAHALCVNDDFMQVYPPEFVEGDARLFTESPDGVIISESFAKRISTGESPLGRSFTIRFSRTEALAQARTYTIVGVIKNYSSFTTFARIPPEVLIKNNDAADNVTLLLRKGMDMTTLNEKLDYIKLHHNEKYENTSFSQAKVYRTSEMKQPLFPLVIISFISFLVLLVGVINFISFAIGSFLNRNRELSLRRTLGGNIKHLFFLLFTELSLVIISAVLLSFALCEWLVPYVYSLIPDVSGVKETFYIQTFRLFGHQLHYGVILLVICACISLIVALRAGLQRSLADARRGTKTGSRHRLRNTMLGVQFFICLQFMYATGVTILTFLTVYEEYKQVPRDETSITLTLYDDYMLQENAYEIIDSLQAKEWCESLYYYKRYWIPYERNGKTYSIGVYYVLPDYFERKDIKIVSGEVYNSDYFCLINRKAQEFLAEDSIYSFIPTMDPQVMYPITGIVDYEEEWRNIAFISLGNEKPTTIPVTIKSGADMKQVQGDINSIIESYLPDGVYNSFKLPNENILANPVAFSFKMTFTFFFVCASICILITILGLYGAITLDTHRKQKEVAIRKINGAGKRTILWLFGRLYVVLYMGSTVMATLITYLIFTNFQQVSNYHFTNAEKVCLYLIVLITAAVIILATIIYRLRRIARLNPSESLKTE